MLSIRFLLVTLSFQRLKNCCTTSIFSQCLVSRAVLRGPHTFYSAVLWPVRVAVTVSNFSVLPLMPFPSSLAGKNMEALVGAFSISVSISRLLASSALSLGYQKQKEKLQENCLGHSWVLRFASLTSSFHLRSLLIFILHTVSRIFICT